MNITKEKLQAYNDFKKESAQRLKALHEQSKENQTYIAQKKEKYHDFVNEDKDDEAMALLDEIEQAQRESKHIVNKIEVLTEREQKAKDERVQSVIDEYPGIKKAYNAEIEKEQQALEKIKKDYMAQVQKIIAISREHSLVGQSYIKVLEENGRSKDRIRMGVPNALTTGAFQITNADLVNGGK